MESVRGTQNLPIGRIAKVLDKVLDISRNLYVGRFYG